MTDRTYIAIDLKSFYASVECMDRQLDPMTTNLVVADESRTEKTICLAVSPSLKKHGIPGRARLFEVILETAEKLGAAFALVTGVASFDDMLAKDVKAVSSAAAAREVAVGMTGREALLLLD